MFGKPVYGLTLGGGGARGGAHLGVLAVLREIGYEPDVIVGTSIGGLVAALAGAGMSVSEIEAAIAAADINHLLSIDRLGEGLVGNVGLAAELRKYFASADLRDLPVKVGVMAVDVRSGERVLIERGPVVEAVLATTAVPGLFPAVQWGERLLVDGGVMSNLPTEATYALGAQRVVAVDVAGRFDLDLALSDLGTLSRRLQRLLYWLLSLSNRQAAFDTLIQSTILSYHALARYEMAAYPPDVLIHPHLPALGIMAMENILDTAPAGREAAEAAAPAIRALMRRPYLLHQRPTHGPPPLVRVGAHPREEAEWA